MMSYILEMGTKNEEKIKRTRIIRIFLTKFVYKKRCGEKNRSNVSIFDVCERKRLKRRRFSGVFLSFWTE